MKTTLHILNGECMYNYFNENQILNDEIMVPFNEAMCYGQTTEKIFSDDFIVTRSQVHQVTLEQYSEITLKPLKPLFNVKYSDLILWFNYDMFCQINLLTILAWLDQSGFNNTVQIKIVNDKYQVMETYDIQTDGYHTIYVQVLIEKKLPELLISKHLLKGIRMYLNYLNDGSELIQYIQRHGNLNNDELVKRLIHEFKHYGLGDTQYLGIIKAILKR